jgi:hypothetical protein
MATPSLIGENLIERIKDTEFDKPTPYIEKKLESLLKPITQVVNDKPSSTSKTNTTATEALKATLRNTKEWKVVVELFQSDEFILPKSFS